MNALSNKNLASGALVAGFLALFYWFSQPYILSYCNDSDLYLSGAESLAEGIGYRYVYYHNSPPLSLYPPLLSGYLALFWKIWPSYPANIPLLNGAMIALGSMSCFLLFFILRGHKVPALPAVLTTLLMGTSPVWFSLMMIFYADIPLTMLGFLLALLWMRNGWGTQTSHWFWTGVFLAAMYLTRTASLALILGMFVVIMAKYREKRARILFSCFAPFVIAYCFWSWATWNCYTYNNYFRDQILCMGISSYLGHCCKQTIEYFAGIHFVDALCPIFCRFPLMKITQTAGLVGAAKGLQYLVALSLVSFVVRGFLRDHNPQKHAIAFLSVVYMWELVLWPYATSGARCLYVLIPFICVWFWQGILSFQQNRHYSTLFKRLVYGVLIVNIVINGYLSSQFGAAGRKDVTEVIDELASWITYDVPATASVSMSSSLPLMLLYHRSKQQFYSEEKWHYHNPLRTHEYPIEERKQYTIRLASNPLDASKGRLVKQTANGHYQLWENSK